MRLSTHLFILFIQYSFDGMHETGPVCLLECNLNLQGAECQVMLQSLNLHGDYSLNCLVRDQLEAEELQHLEKRWKEYGALPQATVREWWLEKSPEIRIKYSSLILEMPSSKYQVKVTGSWGTQKPS